jgi:hypothetical protein
LGEFSLSLQDAYAALDKLLNGCAQHKKDIMERWAVTWLRAAAGLNLITTGGLRAMATEGNQLLYMMAVLPLHTGIHACRQVMDEQQQPMDD